MAKTNICKLTKCKTNNVKQFSLNFSNFQERAEGVKLLRTKNVPAEKLLILEKLRFYKMEISRDRGVAH